VARVRLGELARTHPGEEVVLGRPARVDEIASVTERLEQPGAPDTVPARLANRSSNSPRLSSETVTALITTNDTRRTLLRFAGSGPR
jgi:hypothetical protein